MKKRKTFVRAGIRYSALSDRGKQVQREMLRTRRDKVEIPISILLVTGFTAAQAFYA